MNSKLVVLIMIALTALTPVSASTILVDNLQPSWTEPGTGGVFSAYVTPTHDYTSPGATTLYDGREAGIIKAGIASCPGDITNWDEGLFAFKPAVTINELAANPLRYDVKNQEGTNPVWMTIEIDTGLVGESNRGDNTVYQFVPTANPSGWNTMDAAAGQWQKWNNNDGDVTGNTPVSLNDIAAIHSGLNVVRTYLRLGMGDSYCGTGAGTIAQVDKVEIGGVTYDFVVPKFWYVTPTGSDANEGTLVSPFLTIQRAISAAAPGDTIHIAAGTYTEAGQILISEDISIIGENKATTIIKPAQDTGAGNHQDANAWIVVNPGVTFNLQQVTLDGSGRLLNHGILSHGHGIIDNNLFVNIGYNPSGPDYKGIGIELYGSDMTISNNEFRNIGRIGVYVGFGSTASISGNTYTGKGDGDFLDYGFEVGRNGHATIANNVISGNRGVASVDGSDSAGILVTSYFDPGTPSEATITGNTISGSSTGIAVGYDGSDASVVVAHENSLAGNIFGVKSTNPAVDATNNYWGTAVDATIVSKLSGAVTYAPFYVDAAKTILSSTTPSATFVSSSYADGSADGHYYGYDAFNTIQGGVNVVASTGTVNVAAGAYPESLLVEKSLTLVGTGSKPVISGHSANYIIKINGATNVVLDNLEINGGGAAVGDNAFEYGVLLTNSGTAIAPVEVKNSVIKNVWATSANGVGVEDSYALIHDNAISSFHKRGVRYVHGNGEFFNNDVVGESVDGTNRVQNLVTLWSGSNVEIYNNTLHNALTASGVTPLWDSPAVFVSAYYGGYTDNGISHANVHDNEIYNSDTGVIVGSAYAAGDASTADVTSNNFHNLHWGVNFEQATAAATVQENSFSTVDKAVHAETSAGNLTMPPTLDITHNWWGTNDVANIALLVQGFGNYAPWYSDSTKTSLFFANESMADLVASGILTSSDTNADGLSDVTVTDGTFISIGNSSVTLDAGTIITSNESVDPAAIQALEASGSNLPTGFVANGVLHWGITDLGLEFSQPIHLSIFVGTVLNGQTLQILRSTSGTGSWTSAGIVHPACIVTDGLCKFDATKASFYAATTYTAPANDAETGGTGGDSGGGRVAYTAPTTASAPAPAPAPVEQPVIAPTETPVAAPVAAPAETTPPESNALTGAVTGNPTNSNWYWLGGLVGVILLAGIIYVVMKRR